jgi:hypothetical protein
MKTIIMLVLAQLPRRSGGSRYDWVHSGSTQLFIDPDRMEQYLARAESSYRREQYHDDAKNFPQAREVVSVQHISKAGLKRIMEGFRRVSRV